MEHPLLPGVTHEIVVITPEIAKDYLTQRPSWQRSLSDATVDQYTGDMVADDWEYTGDAIRFNTKGQLIDGQHRLNSIIQSGKPQAMMVIRGLADASLDVIDTNRGRSFTDMLKMREVPSHTAVSALTKRVLHWTLGNYADRSMARRADADFVYARLSNRALWSCYLKFEHEIEKAAREGAYLGVWAGSGSCPPSIFGFAYLLFGRISVEHRDLFFHELKNADEPSQAIRVLRMKMLKGPGTGEDISEVVWLHYIIGIWNKWLNGRTTENLRRPTPMRWDVLAKPIDPLADERPEGWEPL